MDIEGTYYCSKCMRVLDAEKACGHCGYDSAAARRNPAELEEGTLLNERYLLGAIIGSGGFGVTYAAWDEMLRVPIALKEYFPCDYVSRDIRISDDVIPREEHKAAYYVGLRRFIQESQVLAMLRNVPGIVKAFDCFEENGTAYITMEYVRGMALDEYVKAQKPNPKELLRLMKQPIDALAAIHKQGIMHRDITPKNLLAQADGTIKLIDFGSALEISRKSGTIIFTKKYAPIEQYDTSRRQGPWSDVYGICATLYELLTGEAPLESLRREHHDELVPIAVTGVRLKRYEEKAVMQGLAVLPEKRIQSMEELRSMLYNLPVPEEVTRRKRFVRRLSVAAACFFVLTAMAVLNFTTGVPLGGGLLYALYPSGFHVTGLSGVQEELSIPASRLWIPVTAITESAFSGEQALKAVHIPGSVREIGDLAFHQCEHLAMVTAEEGLRNIGDFAFADCPLLHSVSLPDGVETIGPHAFLNDWEQLAIWGTHGSYAESFAAESGVTFADIDDYKYTLSDSGAVFTAYLGDETQVTIPSYMGGAPVVAFAEEAADTAIPPDVTSIVLPEYLDVLNSGVLSDHESLMRVSFGSKLSTLGDGALQNTNIRELTLPEGLTAIGAKALYEVPIEKITFPDSLQFIGASAFYKSDLQEVDFPDGLQSIGEYAFYGNDLQAVELPESVIFVGIDAFSSCAYLETVTWSASATNIPVRALIDCPALQSMIIPEGITSIDWAAFFSCTMLDTIVLPETMEMIDGKAFNSCTRLRAIYIPAGVTKIHDTAFDGCSTSMLIVGHSGSCAEGYANKHSFRFEDCGARENTALAGGSTLVLPTITGGEFVASVERKDITGRDFKNVQMPTMLKSVKEACFKGNANITEVFMENVETIEYEAFEDCENLEFVSFPDGLRWIDDAAFYECVQLKEAILPDSLEYIGEFAFYGCKNLISLHIPTGIHSVGACVFRNTGITEVVIPGNITNCERDSFGECQNLKSVIAEEGLVLIRGSFTDCAALETVVLPSTLRYMSWNPFGRCISLTDVWIYAMETEFSVEDDFYYWNMFEDCPNVTIHAYTGSDMEAYALERGLHFESI